MSLAVAIAVVSSSDADPGRPVSTFGRVSAAASGLGLVVFLTAAVVLYDVSARRSILLTTAALSVGRDRVLLSDLEPPVAWGPDVKDEVRRATGLFPVAGAVGIRVLGGSRRGILGQGKVAVKSRTSHLDETIVVHTWHANRLGGALVPLLRDRDG